MIARYPALNPQIVSTAGIVMVATPKSSCPGRAARKITTKMNGGTYCDCAISTPCVIPVVPVAISASDATASANADGLKMCRNRPPTRQRMNSLPT